MLKSDEQWRAIPGSGCQISNLARFKNTNGVVVTPQIQHRVRNPRKRIVYAVKYAAGPRHYFHVYSMMAKIWPEIQGSYDDAWCVRMKDVVRAEKGWRRRHPLTKKQDRMPDGSKRKLLEYKGWDRDPWDEMHLCGVERDYFSFGQYCPCL